jgi:long-chain fatty acid transport protein
MGGAFAAIADDATAIHHNPAGLALIAPTNVLLDFDIVVPQREYQPAGCSVTAPMLPACAAGTTTRRVESELTTTHLAPALAFSTRFAGAGGDDASRLAVGIGVFYTYGSSIQFSDRTAQSDRPDVKKLSISLLEIVPAVAYQASDVLSVGVGLRIGVGLFDLNAPALNSYPTLDPGGRPYNFATADGSGVSAGGSLGVMLRPVSWLTVGTTYRTALKVSASGTLHVDYRLPPRADQGTTVDLPFPQQATLGVAVRPLARLRLSAQVDWTNWAAFNQLSLSAAPSSYDVRLDLKDTWTAHLGGDYLLGQRAVVRAGYSYDSGAVPAVAADRYLIDMPKHTVAAGAGFALTKSLRLDAAFEVLFASETTVAPSPASTPVLVQNPAPGTYRGTSYQGLVTAQYRY